MTFKVTYEDGKELKIEETNSYYLFEYLMENDMADDIVKIEVIPTRRMIICD